MNFNYDVIISGVITKVGSSLYFSLFYGWNSLNDKENNKNKVIENDINIWIYTKNKYILMEYIYFSSFSLSLSSSLSLRKKNINMVSAIKK